VRCRALLRRLYAWLHDCYARIFRDRSSFLLVLGTLDFSDWSGYDMHGGVTSKIRRALGWPTLDREPNSSYDRRGNFRDLVIWKYPLYFCEHIRAVDEVRDFLIA
jgi:hypothetical protein